MGKKNSNVGWDLHLHIIDFGKQWIYHSFRRSSSSENHLVVVLVFGHKLMALLLLILLFLK